MADRLLFFEWLVDNWPDEDAARRYRQAAHDKDAERAERPLVVNVTVPGMPGYFTGTAGEEAVAYVPAGEPGAADLEVTVPDSAV